MSCFLLPSVSDKRQLQDKNAISNRSQALVWQVLLIILEYSLSQGWANIFCGGPHWIFYYYWGPHACITNVTSIIALKPWKKLYMCYHQGRTAASKVGGGRFQKYLVVKRRFGVYIVREMKHTSQHCYDKIMDGKMALYRECCFPNCTKSWWIKLQYFRRF